MTVDFNNIGVISNYYNYTPVHESEEETFEDYQVYKPMDFDKNNLTSQKVALQIFRCANNYLCCYEKFEDFYLDLASSYEETLSTDSKVYKLVQEEIESFKPFEKDPKLGNLVENHIKFLNEISSISCMHYQQKVLKTILIIVLGALSSTMSFIGTSILKDYFIDHKGPSSAPYAAAFSYALSTWVFIFPILSIPNSPSAFQNRDVFVRTPHPKTLSELNFHLPCEKNASFFTLTNKNKPDFFLSTLAKTNFVIANHFLKSLAQKEAA